MGAVSATPRVREETGEPTLEATRRGAASQDPGYLPHQPERASRVSGSSPDAPPMLRNGYSADAMRRRSPAAVGLLAVLVLSLLAFGQSADAASNVDRLRSQRRAVQ